MKNKKGITINNTLVIIIILGLCIGGIVYYFYNQKRRNYITMAQDYIREARYQVTKTNLSIPINKGDKVVISISQLNPNKKLSNSPFGKKWLIDKSYIVLENIGTDLIPKVSYSIALEDEENNCIRLTEEEKLHRKLVKKECDITSQEETDGLYIEKTY